jgi:hypothetical protein
VQLPHEYPLVPLCCHGEREGFVRLDVANAPSVVNKCVLLLLITWVKIKIVVLYPCEINPSYLHNLAGVIHKIYRYRTGAWTGRM